MAATATKKKSVPAKKTTSTQPVTATPSEGPNVMGLAQMVTQQVAEYSTTFEDTVRTQMDLAREELGRASRLAADICRITSVATAVQSRANVRHQLLHQTQLNGGMMSALILGTQIQDMEEEIAREMGVDIDQCKAWLEQDFERWKSSNEQTTS